MRAAIPTERGDTVERVRAAIPTERGDTVERVRPDGYVAWAAEHPSPDELRAVLRERWS